MLALLTVVDRALVAVGLWRWSSVCCAGHIQRARFDAVVRAWWTTHGACAPVAEEGS